MGRQIAQVLFLILPLIISCRQSVPVVPASGPSAAPAKVADRTFDQPVVVFIYPDNQRIDSIKSQIGADRYFALSDQRGAAFSKIRRLAGKEKVSTWSGITGKYRFKTSDGTMIDIDLGTSRQLWNLIMFNGKDSPVIVNPDEALQLFKKTFNLKKERKRSSFSKPSPVSLPGDSSHFQTSFPDEPFEIIPGIRETTLRLIVFPGQESLPMRNESESIRVVTSFISPNRRFWLEFDNDMFSNTDRYYTNGVVLGYSAPGLTSWKINRLMLNRNNNSVVHSSISLHHGMFTPLTTKEPPPMHDDRPYASTLYLRYNQVSEDADAGIMIVSAIEAGIIGDAALGRLMQKTVHSGIPSNDEPQGWETQIKNDLVLNYDINFHKQLINSRYTGVYAVGSISAGTLYSNATMGINAIAGICQTGLTPLPEEYDDLSASTGNWQYGFTGGLELRMVGYDATLQGGLFNKNNIYALKPGEIERLVAAMHIGLFAGYKKLGLSISQFYLSPEFKTGKQHFWGRVGLNYGW